MSTPEGKVKDAIKVVLKRMQFYYHMPVQNGMGKPTLDFIICGRGRFIAIEAKADNGKLTLRQELTIKEMQQAGAIVLVVTGVEEAKRVGETLALLGAV